ncbi:ATP-binding protein [Patescibacteria group bacterium]|nr:ATP-binding protein [Patescibacteria group bacterium]
MPNLTLNPAEIPHRFLNSLWDEAPVIAFLVDKQGKIFDANRMAWEDFESTFDTLFGESFSGLFLPLERERIEEFIRIGFALSERSPFEVFQAPSKKGSSIPRFLELTSSQINPDNAGRMLLILVRNVSRTVWLLSQQEEAKHEAEKTALAMRYSEQKLQAALGTGNMGTWELDLESGLLEWSLGAKAAFKGTYQKYLEDVVPEDRNKIFSQINKVIHKKSSTFRQEFSLNTPDGETHRIESNGRLVSSDPVLRIISGVWIDVSKRRFAQQRLETQYAVSQILSHNLELEKALPSILEQLTAGLDWDQAAFLTNDEVLAQYKISRQEIKKCQPEISQAFNLRSVCWLTNKPTGTCLAFPILFHNAAEAVIVMKSPEVKVINREMKKFFAIFGSQLGEYIQRYKEHAQLENSRIQLESIFQNVTEGVLVFGPKGKIIFANKASVGLLDFPNTESLMAAGEKGFVAKFSLNDWQGDRVKLSNLPGHQALSRGEEASLVVRCRHLKKGTEKWLLIKSRPILNSSGKVQMAVTIMEDISEQISGQHQKELFLGVAGHELKTPIMSIKAFAQLARRAPDKKYLEKIDEQANRLTRIINEILDVTRIRAGRLEFRKQKIDLNELLRKNLSIVKPVLEGHKIVNRISGRRAWVHGDSDRLSQVASNLLVNAAKYSPTGSRIIISSQVDRKEIIVSIQDFGIGIPKENQKHIFDSYYRIRNTRANNTDGLGLGLFITASIVKAHNGKIWVKSAPGKGSTFTFSLPLTKSRSK